MPRYAGVSEGADGVAEEYLRADRPVEPPEVCWMAEFAVDAIRDQLVSLCAGSHNFMGKVLATLPHGCRSHALSHEEDACPKKGEVQVVLPRAPKKVRLHDELYPCSDIRQCIAHAVINQVRLIAEDLWLLHCSDEKLSEMKEAQKRDIRRPLQ